MVSALLFIIIALIYQVLSIEPLESPQTQHVRDGTSATFICRASSYNAFWDVQLPNRTQHLIIKRYNSNVYNADGIFTETNSSGSIQTLTLRIEARSSYNNTLVICKGHSGTGEWSSNPPAKLLVYESLRPLPPLTIRITSINTTALRVQWRPSFLWEGYTVNYYNINVYHINGSTSPQSPINCSDEQYTYVLDTIPVTPCTQLNFSITAVSTQYGESDPTSVVGGFDTVPGNISQDLITNNVYFRSNGTPLIDLKFQLPVTVCSYQQLSYTITVEDSETNMMVTSLGPYLSTGPEKLNHSITSGLILDHKYTISVMLNSIVGNSLTKVYLNTSLDPDLYPTQPPCTSGNLANRQNPNLFTYKVTMGACLGLAALMLFTLVFVLLCFLIHRQRKISQGKALNISTNRMQNAMVHNPIYDGPVYESVQPHFDTLTASVKQDLSLSSTSASNSPPGSSTPPNVGSTNYSQKMVRYYDQPIQPRSQSLSHPSTPDNNNPRSTCVCAQAATKVMGLKKNGKERNKLHLTLTLNGNESANPAFGVPCRKKEEVVLAGDLPGNKRAVTSDGDENYTVMSPIKRKDGGNIEKVTELSPEDTDKYKEEVN